MREYGVDPCPQCGGTKIGRGKQSGYGTISPYGRLGFGTALIHLICTDCGWILGSYVENPGSFRKTVVK
ncbi:transcription initiation factor TFIIIB [Sporosarcina cyprini]|uniref:transcription initiation factor TFIIIB n=1 Tax=Sporosarcina cyprini TaxID=2910523 RepID=UPI001EDE1D64|nr:transcription initiation factor TFIIIB [Sporosarcina cyprini]MCG3088960.1 transcription initiation factor TFIIIB [Sporosarcina cyprini]